MNAPTAAPEPRSTPGPSTGTPEPSQAASEACGGEVARLREALEQVRALARRGVGTDLNPTVARPEVSWWYGYLRSHDNHWRDRLDRILAAVDESR